MEISIYKKYLIIYSIIYFVFLIKINNFFNDFLLTLATLQSYTWKIEEMRLCKLIKA